MAHKDLKKIAKMKYRPQSNGRVEYFIMKKQKNIADCQIVKAKKQWPTKKDPKGSIKC